MGHIHAYPEFLPEPRIFNSGETFQSLLVQRVNDNGTVIVFIACYKNVFGCQILCWTYANGKYQQVHERHKLIKAHDRKYSLLKVVQGSNLYR